ncbi:dynamin family protein [Dactylosporangium sp. AC04546]|uniref:dynamin family protein n=1 Tax=Dactylosporangium sp. AC04546 TaxID=2862460 RepID=UPI001EE09139|nr:dynamin family protein [Dactylosporangium sp. AC04546]WVK87010.1 dynamin family protein [Dactylosporangium sp. AC04546]
MTRKSRHPLATAVADLAGRIADISDRVGEEQTGLLLRHRAQLAGFPGSTLVVVGEKNRGKSSLINALIEREDLLPVNADIATHTYVVVRHGVPEEARAFTPNDIDGVDIGIDRIAEFAGLADQGEDREPLHPDVVRVEVTVDSPLLRDGLVLVDTPGVGGLVAGHTAVTLATLDRADALVFVVNGAGELHKSELDFLKKAADRTSTVLFVLTRIDTYPQYQQVLAKNLELLRTHAPSLAKSPWFPVSSRQRFEAGRAEASGDPDFARELRENSGFDALTQELTGRVLLRVEQDLLLGVVAVGANAVEQMDAVAATGITLLTPDEATIQSINAQREVTNALSDPNAPWHAELSQRLTAVRDELRQHAAAGVRGLRATADAAIDEGGRDMLVSVPRDFADGSRGLAMELESRLRSEVVDVTTWLAGELRLAGVDSTATPLGHRPGADAAPTADAPAGGLVDWPTPTMPGTDALSAVGGADQYGKMLREPAGNALRKFGEIWRAIEPKRQRNIVIAAVAVTIAATVGIVGWVVSRRRSASRKALIEEIDRGTTDLYTTLDAQLVAEVDRLRAEITSNATRQLAHRFSSLANAYTEAQANLTAAEADLAPRRKLLEERRGELATLRGEVTELRERLARLEP